WVTVAASQDLDVDSNGVVHLVYQASDNILGCYSIIYMNNSAGSFTQFELINQTDYDLSPSIKIDKNDNVHIVFRGKRESVESITYFDIFYVNNSVTSFNSSTPIKVSTVTTALSPRIMISNNYTVNLVYYGWDESLPEDNLKLYYTSNSTGSFEQETALPYQGYGQCPAAVIDNSDNIHVVYMSGETGDEDIYYITTSSYYPVGVGEPPDPTWIFMTLGIVGGGIGLAIFVVLYRKFKAIEREVWKPDLGDESESAE
ncbi:MAG: hypothetical protein ACTSYR_00555, partial [Candidatus Odinarchaeia archaeon]